MSETKTGETIDLTSADRGKTIAVKVGTTVCYGASFGTSAYQWREPIVTGTGIQYEGPLSRGDSRCSDEPPMPGETSQLYFTFYAASPGTSSIELIQGYMHAEEFDVSFQVTVEVIE